MADGGEFGMLVDVRPSYPGVLGVPKLPAGLVVLTDDDGVFLTDEDGALLLGEDQ